MRDARRHCKLTQAEIAEKMKLGVKYYAALEAGTANIIIAVQLVLKMGSILESNTDLALLLYRPSTYSMADVIGTYVYREGIQGGKYSYTTAIGLFNSIINVVLLIIANTTSKRFSENSLW